MQRRIRTVCLCLLLTLTLFSFSGCKTIRKDEVDRMDAKKLGDYLYYMELDSYLFWEMPPEDSPLFTFGCSSVRKGNLYGRNLDLNYCDTPEFVICLSAAEDRYASIGVCADPTITSDVSKMTPEDLLSLPNITNDGINENGVIVSVNIVDASGVDDMRGTFPGGRRIHSSRVVRYLLDHADSAGHAVELLKSLDIVGGFAGSGLHWMIADGKDTFVCEIIHGGLVVSRNEHFFMTNFYLNYGPRQKDQSVAELHFQDLPLLNDYAIGVERWCLLREGYDSIKGEEDMTRLLEAVKGSAMYNEELSSRWYSECSGGALSISSSREAFDEAYKAQMELFCNRSRENPQGVWMTWHTSLYHIQERTLTLYSQEDYSVKYTFDLP